MSSAQTTLSHEDVIKMIAQFNIPGWNTSTKDQVTITPFASGQVNTTLFVERHTSDQDTKGPTKLVYKVYGGNTYGDEGYLQANSPILQSLIFHEQSKHGWGPKLYGIFENGRVEECIDCHTLKYEEAFIPEISHDLAKAYARFHSLKLPFAHEPLASLTRLWSGFSESKEILAKAIQSNSIKDDQMVASFNRLLDFPFDEEIDWVFRVFDKINQRIVLCSFDPNYMNRLVRNEVPSNSNTTRSIIIDYDFTAYSYRGYDLGGHFVNRCFNWPSKVSKVTNLSYPSEEERRAFLSFYLQECEPLFDDFDKSSLDSLENVTLEADSHALTYNIVLLSFGLTVHETIQVQPVFYTFISPMLDLYEVLKRQFLEKHPNLI